MVHENNTSQRDTSIYIALDLQFLPHMVSEWVSVPMSQKNPEEKCIPIYISLLEYFSQG